MNVTSIGDLAQGLVLRSRGARIKSTIAKLTEELSSGRITDVSKKLNGDYAYLSDIEHKVARLSGYAEAANEAAILARSTQGGLQRLQDVSGALAVDLLSVTPTTLPTVQNHAGDKARGALDAMMSALNQNVGGRSIFSGTATDRAPLASADTLMAALEAHVGALTTTVAITAAVDAWFADPAGFPAVMYSGSNQSLAPMQVGPNEHVNISLRADDPAFRDTIRNTAIAALATVPALALSVDVRNSLLREAGEGLLGDQETLTGLRADMGYAEARIEEASTRNASAKTGLEMARNTLLGADPYETAARLHEAQFHLEGLYSVTVRTSRLSLLSFLQ